jgi:hypothetical protein
MFLSDVVAAVPTYTCNRVSTSSNPIALIGCGTSDANGWPIQIQMRCALCISCSLEPIEVSFGCKISCCSLLSHCALASFSTFLV